MGARPPLEREREAATARRTWLDRQRFRPQQWSTQASWRGYAHDAGERWFGFEGAQQLDGLPPEILLVPLFGHTLGHAGVAVARGDDWVLDAGDAYFFHMEMDFHPWCTPGLRFYQTLMEKDRSARLVNQARLRELRFTNGSRVELFCSHDVREFERLSGRSAAMPTEFLREFTSEKELKHVGFQG